MASNTEIANLALSHIGVGKEIANLDTEKSQEAVAIRRFYDTLLDRTLRQFPWPFARKEIALALVRETPDGEYQFEYRYPTDCVLFRRIKSGLRNDTRQSRIKYRISRDSSGLLVLTDEQNAESEFTLRETDAGRYPSDFVMAFSFLIAYIVAPRLTKGDPFKLQRSVLTLFVQEISAARAAAANEEQLDEKPESQFIREREGESADGASRQSFLDQFG